ncbi:uncharacterized protein DS421_3g71630 [Arachis hypogaea]|uniref:CCHC-type domain-containing protein n=1 Tax=Arachis hypogaea TaxID=3818 RepID=A0A445E178_ARAHY|nr:uncharacterized protein DS421_3g71630 [Arachis hypogaea]RYR69136.1 hypothetical protein Ahy_A03g015670 [Arachis hypogaea]
MKTLRLKNEGAFRHLNRIPPRFWSRSRFSFHSKYDSLVNNMSESFNAVIVEAREKPIVTMLEDIRVYIMTRWAANRDRIHKYQGNIMPTIRKKLEKKDKVMLGTGGHFGQLLEVIHPLNGPDLWERSQYDDVMPPPYRRPSHRPVKKRKRGPGDEDNRSQTHLSRRGQTQRCSNCGALGHKKSGCTKPIKKVHPASQQSGKGPRRGTKVASSQPPGQTVQREKLSRKSCSQPSPATTYSNTATTQPHKPVTRPRKLASRPTEQSTQPKNQTKKVAGPAPPQSNLKAPSSQPLPSKSSAAASSTSKKNSHSQPTERKRHFSIIQTGAPHIPNQKLKLMAKLPPSAWAIFKED